MKIKTGDNVIVQIGKDKNRQGQVVKVFPKQKKAIVKDINLSKRHVKSSQDKPGGIIDKEMPLYISKLALICPLCKKATRVGYQLDSSGLKQRFCKKCQGLIDTKKPVTSQPKKLVKSKK